MLLPFRLHWLFTLAQSGTMNFGQTRHICAQTSLETWTAIWCIFNHYKQLKLQRRSKCGGEHIAWSAWILWGVIWPSWSRWAGHAMIRQHFMFFTTLASLAIWGANISLTARLKSFGTQPKDKNNLTQTIPPNTTLKSHNKLQLWIPAKVIKLRMQKQILLSRMMIVRMQRGTNANALISYRSCKEGELCASTRIQAVGSAPIMFPEKGLNSIELCRLLL